jgi:NADH-quinone oxidoreductase subunit M
MGSLSLLIFIPLIALVAVFIIPSRYKTVFKWISLGVSLLQTAIFFLVTLPSYNLDMGSGAYRVVENLEWISLNLGSLGSLHMQYHLGLDGLSLMMVMLSVIILPIAALSSWKMQHRSKTYFALLMLLNTSMIGCFVALDFFLFYIFYELMLLPMFFLIGIWGGPRRQYASLKFLLYTLFGSVFMLLIMVGLSFSFIDPGHSAVLVGLADTYDQVTPANIAQIQEMLANAELPVHQQAHTFNMLHMMAASPQSPEPLNLVRDAIFGFDGQLLGMNARLLGFLILFIGFAIKVPMVPVHTWLPDAHVQASTAISVILAAILLKVGAYGVIRICYGIFPEGGFVFGWWIGLLGMISIIYGGLVALAQKDLKSLIAYSSVSHMGFVMLGIASLHATGMNGAVFQMFNHGIISAASFLIVGVIYDRTHDREIAHYSGLWSKMPRFSIVVLITFFASFGLPGMNGFVSEMLILFGGFAADYPSSRVFALIATSGIFLAAVFYLRTYRRMFFGKFDYLGENRIEGMEALKDLQNREYLMLVPLVLLMILFGVLPSLVLNLADVSISALTQDISTRGLHYLPLIH